MKNFTTSAAKALTLLLFFAGLKSLSAQDTNTDNHQITISIPQVALLDIEGPGGVKNFNASFTHSGEAGAPVVKPAINSSLWLNYSSILAEGTTTTRNVKVSVGALVPGVDIKLTAGAATGGGGTLGTPSSVLTLSATPQNLITGIGSAYTEDGVSHGHQLSYDVSYLVASYGSLRSGTPQVVTVTYTLADN